METHMETKEPEQTFRLGPHSNVVVLFGFDEKPDGRSWPTFRVGRLYLKNGKEFFVPGLRINDLGAAQELLSDAVRWVAANPQAVKTGVEA